MPAPYKRIRLLIYTHDTQEGLDWQRLNDTREKYVRSGSGRGAMRLESFELNPLRMTVLELLRLFGREARRKP